MLSEEHSSMLTAWLCKMAEDVSHSDLLYNFPGKNGHSQIWLYFGFRKSYINT